MSSVDQSSRTVCIATVWVSLAMVYSSATRWFASWWRSNMVTRLHIGSMDVTLVRCRCSIPTFRERTRNRRSRVRLARDLIQDLQPWDEQ